MLNMYKSQNNYTEWKKPDAFLTTTNKKTEDILYDSIYIKSWKMQTAQVSDYLEAE